MGFIRIMLSASVFSVFCLSNIFAQESGSITDLMYMPAKSSIVIQPGFSHNGSSYDMSLPASTHITNASGDDSDNTFRISAGYGLTDFCALYLAESFATSKSESSYTYYGLHYSSSDKSKGMEDPDVGVKFRVHDIPLLLDFTAAYSPKVFKSRYSSDDEDGTMGSGGHAVTLETEVGKKAGKVSYSFGLQGRYFTKRIASGEDGDEEETGGQQVLMRSEIQYIAKEKMLLRGGLFFGYKTKSEKWISEADYHKYDPQKYIGFGAGLGFVVVPEKALINFAFTFVKGMNVDVIEMNDSTLTEFTVKNNNSIDFEISMKFQI
jgi:hypothetical protein